MPRRVSEKASAHVPQNNKMQLTRSGHSRWRSSQLILVFYGRFTEQQDGECRAIDAGSSSAT